MIMCSGSGADLSILVYLTGGDHWLGGIQYTRNLLRALEFLPEGEMPRIVLRISDQNKSGSYDKEFSAIRGVEIDDLVPPNSVKKFLLSLLGKKCRPQFKGDRCDVAFPVKVPGLRSHAQAIHWIPDFQYKYYPNYFSDEERAKRDAMYEKMFAEAKLFIFSSRSTESDFRKFFPQASRIGTRVMPFYSTIYPQELANHPHDILMKHGLPERFLYAPNQFWQHKGHDILIEALGRLKKRGLVIPLVCTGSLSDYRTDAYIQHLNALIDEHGLREHIYLLGVLPREEQLQVFRAASLIVQASRFEGWSTVVEDARLLGKPIVLSDIPVHVEQSPAQSRFFKDGDVVELTRELEAAWNSAPSGHQPEEENFAISENRKRALDFARNFLSIARDVKSLK